MKQLDDVLRRVDTVTFDCYGTLIDWHNGLLAAFSEMFGAEAASSSDRLCSAYRRIEGQVQAELTGGRFLSYRDVLAEVSRRLAAEIGVTLPPDGDRILARRLPTWRPFPDTNAALTRLKSRYRLGVLSNIDRDLFAGTAGHFDVAMDFVVTAEDVGAYKPAHAHFARAVELCGEGRFLHVAESLYHDGGPAGELGIPFVWINRYDSRKESGLSPVGEFRDLATLTGRV